MSELFAPCTPKARDFDVAIPDGFTLSSGQPFSGVVRARLIGPRRGALIVAAGGISAGRRAADDEVGAGWWGWAIGSGAAINTGRHRLLTLDFAPEADVGEVLTISTHDQAALLALVLDHLEEPSIDAFVGASYGGCVGLAFAEAYPERLGRLVVISAPHRTHPSATAWRGVQRRILQLGLDTGREDEAIALARELAMTTYRSAEEFGERFEPGPAPAAAGEAYPVCDYLLARGRDYPAQTSARRWIALSDSLDRHSVDPAAIKAPLTIVAFTTDRLVPIADLQDLAAAAPNLTALIEAPSLYGHDAFLKERAVVGDALRTALSDLTYTCSEEIAA